jgi:tRNA(Ile)-lysidine synthase
MIMMNPFILKILKYIRRMRLIDSGDAVLMSLSAGKDSMALLEAMLVLRREIDCSLAVFHLNHGIRGDESDDDERFLQERVEREGIALHCRRHDFSILPGGVSFEDHARRVRYAMLEETSGLHAYNKIVTAHTMTDNYETMLMRMFEGTGPAGMAGIKPVRGSIVRPMLCVTSNEVTDFLRESDVAWREDRTNSDTSYLRNYVRHEICPRIAGRFPRAERALVGLGEISGEYADMLDEFIVKSYGTVYERDGDEGVIRCDVIAEDRRVFTHVLARAMSDFGIFFSRGILEEIQRKFLSEKRSMDLYKTGEITLTAERSDSGAIIRLRHGGTDEAEPVGAWEYRIPMPENGKTPVFIAETGIRLCLERCGFDYFKANYQRTDMVFLDLQSPRDYIVIRNRRPGDRLATGGMTRKVKDIMIENKLDTLAKNSIPLVIVDSRVAAMMLGLYRPVPSRVSGDFLVRDASKYIVSVYRISC